MAKGGPALTHTKGKSPVCGSDGGVIGNGNPLKGFKGVMNKHTGAAKVK